MIRTLFLKIIDSFYFLCQRFLDKQTYRYAVCGSLNTTFDISLYFTIFHFILKQEPVEFPSFIISPHIAAFLLSFLVTFPTGFFLMRSIVFPDSQIRGRVQLARYFSVVLANIFSNYILLKVFVEVLGLYPTPSKLLITVIIVAFTYLMQKNFTFKSKPKLLIEEEEELEAEKVI
jgi:putative flippase GtrA